MKVILVTFVAAVLTAVFADQVRVLDRVDFNDGFGNYRYFYELSDGTVVEQKGEFRNRGTPNEEFVVTGFYFYNAPNGENQLTEYISDKDGDHKQTSSGPGALPPRTVASMLSG